MKALFWALETFFCRYLPCTFSYLTHVISVISDFVYFRLQTVSPNHFRLQGLFTWNLLVVLIQTCLNLLDVLDGSLFSSGEGLLTHNFNIHNINDIIIQNVSDWINKQKKIRSRTLFEARKVAGSATYKQSKTVCNCVVLQDHIVYSVMKTKRVCSFNLLGQKGISQWRSFSFFPKTT